MMDFTVGEPIRLLPCMHFYHMRCIDDWLMRSYSCPSCMERVDVGMRNTIISSTSLPFAAVATSGVRRRRRRRDRGSSSSIASGVSLGSNHGGAEEGKRRDKGGQFVPQYRQGSGQEEPSGHPSRAASGHDTSTSGHDTPASGQATKWSGHVGGHMDYITDQYTSGQSDNASGQATEDRATGQSYEASGHIHNPAIHSSPADPAYSMDGMEPITFSDFHSSTAVPQAAQGYFSPPSSPVARSPDVGVAPLSPFSPPVFERHFEYPSNH